MRFRGRSGPHGGGLTKTQRGVAFGTVAVAIIGTIAAYAFSSPGYAQAQVNLSRTTVWTTNRSQALVGRVNGQIDQLDSALKANPDFDVLQDQLPAADGSGQPIDQVLVVDRTKDQLKAVDDTTVTTGANIGLPHANAVALGGATIAIADETTGKL